MAELAGLEEPPQGIVLVALVDVNVWRLAADPLQHVVAAGFLVLLEDGIVGKPRALYW